MQIVQGAQQLSYYVQGQIGQCATLPEGLHLADPWGAVTLAAGAVVVGTLIVLAYHYGYHEGKNEVLGAELESERAGRPQVDSDRLAERRRIFFETMAEDPKFTTDVIADRMKVWDAEKFTA